MDLIVTNPLAGCENPSVPCVRLQQALWGTPPTLATSFLLGELRPLESIPALNAWMQGG